LVPRKELMERKVQKSKDIFLTKLTMLGMVMGKTGDIKKVWIESLFVLMVSPKHKKFLLVI